MLIIPAIDLREGKCVRLVEGKIENETIYSDNPVAVAELWTKQGAPMLHLVDLDGAFTGSLQNKDIVQEIVKEVHIPVQVGGGIRNLDSVEQLLSIGVKRVILGTVAINNPRICKEAYREFGDRVVIGIDGKNDLVAVEGWGQTVDKTTVQLAREMKELGIKHIVYTDTRRDGTLKGPNLKSIKDIALAFGTGVIASGGVAVPDDVRNIKELEQYGVDALIIGKALYTGSVKLSDAIKIAVGR